MGVVAQCREGVYKYFADVEDAEKHFHVGDMGVGVMGRGHGHYLVDMWHVCGFMAGRWC